MSNLKEAHAFWSRIFSSIIAPFILKWHECCVWRKVPEKYYLNSAYYIVKRKKKLEIVHKTVPGFYEIVVIDLKEVLPLLVYTC